MEGFWFQCGGINKNKVKLANNFVPNKNSSYVEIVPVESSVANPKKETVIYLLKNCQGKNCQACIQRQAAPNLSTCGIFFIADFGRQ